MFKTFACMGGLQHTRADRHLLTSTGFERDLITRNIRNWYHRDTQTIPEAYAFAGRKGKGSDLAVWSTFTEHWGTALSCCDR